MIKNAYEKILDMESVLFLIGHIESPCTVEANGKTYNIRDFYLREAEILKPKLISSNAQDLLQWYIEKYKK